jgi:hypothetical protein
VVVRISGGASNSSTARVGADWTRISGTSSRAMRNVSSISPLWAGNSRWLGVRTALAAKLAFPIRNHVDSINAGARVRFVTSKSAAHASSSASTSNGSPFSTYRVRAQSSGLVIA